MPSKVTADPAGVKTRRGQIRLSISDFDGVHSYPRIYNNVPGDSIDAVLLRGLEACYDMMITPLGHLVPRPGIRKFSEIGVARPGIRRILPFPMASNRYILITYGGEVFDTGFSTVAPILSATVGSDLAIQTFGKRCFISVLDGVYVWDPALMSTARPAAGAKPTGTFTVAVSATAGHIEVGQHIYAVSYETNTGFITKPNLFVSLTNTAGKKVDLSVIPTGPTGTVARHILMSKVLKNWDGNLQNPELFFALRIADNTTVALTGANGLDKYDTELVSSADYLKDILETLTRVNDLSVYGGRLVLVGGTTPDVPIRVSQPGDMETFLATEGYIKTLPQDGGISRAAFAGYGLLYILKDSMTFSTQDTGDSPTRWPSLQVDSSRGCASLGVAKTAGGSPNVEDGALILTRTGLYFFNGRYGDLPLTQKIQGLFYDLLSTSSITYGVNSDSVFQNWNVVVDTHRKTIYIFVGTPSLIRYVDGVLQSQGAADPDGYTNPQVLVGDYSRGLSWDMIRWTVFRHYNSLQCMTISQTDSYLPSLIFGWGRQNAVHAYIFTMDPPELYNATDAFADKIDSGLFQPVTYKMLFGAATLLPDGGRITLEAVRLRLATMGVTPDPLTAITLTTIGVRIYSEESGAYVNAPSIVPDVKMPKTYLSQCNVSAEQVKVELSYTGSSPQTADPVRGIRITRLHLYGREDSEEYPA